MTINDVSEALWLRLHVILAALAEKLCAGDPTLIHNLGRTANDAFPLRGYLTFSRHAHGDEVAITVDVRSVNQQLTVESDACTDDGRVIAAGPSVAIPLLESDSNVKVAIDDWLREFERFLKENESAVATAAAKLI